MGGKVAAPKVVNVSDLRASTPSAAAEKAVPVRAELIDSIQLKFEKISIKFNKSMSYSIVHFIFIYSIKFFK